jgi:hypothetical protein
MAQTAKTKPRLVPTPRQLAKALEESAEKAHRLAKAFGKTIRTNQSARSRQSASA